MGKRVAAMVLAVGLATGVVLAAGTALAGGEALAGSEVLPDGNALPDASYLSESTQVWDGGVPESSDTVYVESDVADDIVAGETVIDGGEQPEYIQWLLEIAIEELGYTEGSNNLSKYGTWAGKPNDAWCAEFLCWCVDQVDKRYGTELLKAVYPFYTAQNTGRDWFIAQGRFVYRKGNCPNWGYQWILGETKLMEKNDYIPLPGDWVFFSYNEAGDTEHVAMVEYSAKDAEGNVILHVIEGNNPSGVSRNTYSLNNSQVLGFGTPVERVGTTMRGGNRGGKVLALQRDLHELGFLEERHLTGTYGGHTKNAVAAFQKTMEDKKATGIADMETQIAMANILAVKAFNAAETWLVGE